MGSFWANAVACGSYPSSEKSEAKTEITRNNVDKPWRNERTGTSFCFNARIVPHRRWSEPRSKYGKNLLL
jgi:hypothetical protein